MSFKTILVHVDESRRTNERIALAARLARRHEGHLVGAAVTGVSRFLYKNELLDENDPNLLAHLGFLRERAQRTLAGFGPLMGQTGLSSFETRVIDDEAGGGISLHGRYADLVVLGQTDPDEPAPSVMPDFVGHVVLNTVRPVLVLPHTGTFADFGEGGPRTVALAWDASREATRAATLALPFLKRAASVHLLVIDPELDGGLHGEQAGADIALYLARHGVRVNVQVHQAGRHGRQGKPRDVGQALLAQAGGLQAELLVMGAFGHSRFRETILGGVTRTVLESMTLPVLMAH